MTTHEPHRKPHVLLINDHLGWDGLVMHGVGRLFLQWAPFFDQGKYQATICILRKKDALSTYFEKQGIRLVFLEKHRYDPSTLSSLVRLIRRENIDVIHVQGFGGATFGRLASLITGVPVIVHFHDTSPKYPMVQKIADLALGRFTDGVIANSHSVKRFNLQNARLPGFDPEKIVVMHNSVTLEDFQPFSQHDVMAEKNRLGIAPETKIVGTVTRLYEEKGNRYFLEAAHEILDVYPQTVFLIVGDGPQRTDLEGLSQQLGIAQHVIFAGFSADVPRLLATFDVKVFTAWTGDGGVPLVILEAMAMGKPIVSTDVIEVLDDGVTGLLVPPKDPHAIAEKILMILDDGVLAEQLGARARHESRKYDTSAYLRRLEALYDNVLDRSSGKRNVLQRVLTPRNG